MHLIIKTQKENKDSNFLIICDHASNNIPSNFANLGLDKEILDTHIAYDIGAKEVSVHLSNILDCPLVMSDFSRFVELIKSTASCVKRHGVLIV